MGRVAAPVVALVLLTILPPAAAVAQVRDPAVDQYVESVPGATGDTGTPKGGAGPDGGGLPSDLKRQIESEGGADAAALEAVGSSPELGSSASGRRQTAAGDLPHGSGDSPSTLDAVASATVSGDGNAGGWLLAGLAVLTAALGATAFARRSKPR